MDYVGFLFLKRSWRQDEEQIKFVVRKIKSETPRVFFIMFPEGTDFTPRKQISSNQFAKEQQLAPLKHLLIPRMKGLVAVIQNFGNFLDAIYDCTIAYEGQEKPTLLTGLRKRNSDYFSNWDLNTLLNPGWCGHFPKKVYLHIRRIPFSSIPSSSNGITSWCNQLWEEKDQLLDSFAQHNSFSPNEQLLPSEIDTSRLIIFIFFTVFWSLFLPILIYLTFFVSWWITGYVITTWVFLLLSSFSERIRIWRGLNAALKST